MGPGSTSSRSVSTVTARHRVTVATVHPSVSAVEQNQSQGQECLTENVMDGYDDDLFGTTGSRSMEENGSDVSFGSSSVSLTQSGDNM